MKMIVPQLYCMLALAIPLIGHAQVQLERTRLVFSAGDTEKAFQVRNAASEPVMLQTWITDDGAGLDDAPADADVPFIVVPPLQALAPGADLQIRIRALVGRVPDDEREHLYWLNLQEAPVAAPQGKGGSLQIAVRSRVKLLYRPEGVAAPTDPDAAVSFSQCAGVAASSGLRVVNAARWYFNLGHMEVVGGQGTQEIALFQIPPHSDQCIALPADLRQLRELRYSWLDDMGTLQETRRVLPSLDR